MKVLHTSDWHLGHILYEHDRTAEHACFIRQLKEIVSKEKPDVMIVCGDVYDRTNPSVQVQKMYYQSLLEIHSAFVDMPVIVTAGNHDSKSMLELGRDLWNLAGVHVVGQVDRDNLDRHIIEVSDACGHTKGWVIAVPHIYEQNYPAIGDCTGREERRRAFYQALLDRTDALNRGRYPVVMTGHLTVAGCDITGHDFDTVGGIEQVPQSELGKGYDYLALGHIHRPQTLLAGNAVARYCGSPVPVSFDENYAHSVSIVDVGRGKVNEIREIVIRNIKPMFTVPSRPVSFKEAVAALGDIRNDESCYVRLNVLLDGPMPSDYVERIEKVLKGKKAEFCYCKVTRDVAVKDENDVIMTFDEFQEMEPLEVARRYYRLRHGVDIPEKKLDMIGQAMDMAREGKDI